MQRWKMAAAGVLATTSLGIYLYAEQLDDQHEELVIDQVEVVKLSDRATPGTRLTKDVITTEMVPRKFLPPNPVLADDLAIYLGQPLAHGGAGGAMLQQTDFLFQPQRSSYDPMPQRMVIKTGHVTLESDAPSDASAVLRTMAQRSGGYVVSSKTSSSSRGSEVTMTVRVDPAHFDDSLDSVRRLGHLVSEEVTGDDVTEEFVDFSSKIRNKKALEERFVRLLAETKGIEEAIDVEKEVASVRADIDKLEGRAQFLEHQTALATIHLIIITPQVATDEGRSATELERQLRRTVDDSLSIMGTVAGVLIRLVAGLLPVVLMVGPLVVATSALRRRKRRSDSGTPS